MSQSGDQERTKMKTQIQESSSTDEYLSHEMDDVIQRGDTIQNGERRCSRRGKNPKEQQNLREKGPATESTNLWTQS